MYYKRPVYSSSSYTMHYAQLSTKTCGKILKGIRQLEETKQDLIVAGMSELSDKGFETVDYAKGSNGQSRLHGGTDG